MAKLTDLKDLGYETDVDNDNGIAAVRGNGVAIVVDIDDQVAIDSLAIAAAEASE